MDLTDVSTLRALLERHGLAARKGLGQHFLVSKAAVRAIVSRLEGIAGILEIGPGPGVLTGPLSEACQRLLALELDETMIAALRESSPRADVLQADALDADLTKLLLSLPEPRAVVSNLPYYITGPLVTRIAEARETYGKAVLMMQKEVGLRILAPPGDSGRGSLSVFIQTGFDVAKVADVPSGGFWPPPKVDSVVLELTPKPSGLTATEEPLYFKLVRASFRQPRKTLANNFAAAGYARGAIGSALENAGLDLRCRPADPDLEAWRALFRSLQGA
jgi:16S rRNA (adenine1518-N6/adenine1519-N6)-dimethyltransferase